MSGSVNRVSLGVVQCELDGSEEANMARLEPLVQRAAEDGANVIVTPELVDGPYFPQAQRVDFFRRAAPIEGHPVVEVFRQWARRWDAVMPVSVFERDGHHHYNTVVMLDRNGDVLGRYRKAHIPDGPGYQEKYYFRPGPGSFEVWPTDFGVLGVGICWDQWFPEVARCLCIQGAEFVLYPTAIGNEPQAPQEDTKALWQRVMVGHAVANAVPVLAANRTGCEGDLEFYGSSFVSDGEGEIEELARNGAGVLVKGFDREALRQRRADWGFFRDRRPELYGALVRP